MLQGFAKDKSPGSNGCPVEFLLSFFYLVGNDLLAAVEQTHLEGCFQKVLNVTYITLMPKCENLETFADFRPISLCNLLYKVIKNIISDKLKPLLADAILGERFGFLKNREILEVVGITQEVLHSIKARKLEALILKMDLVKAYDRVNWTLLMLLLL